MLRDWILDVPVEFAVTPEQRSYLSLLVAFHGITILLVSVALRFSRSSDHQD